MCCVLVVVVPVPVFVPTPPLSEAGCLEPGCLWSCRGKFGQNVERFSLFSLKKCNERLNIETDTCNKYSKIPSCQSTVLVLIKYLQMLQAW